MRKFLAATLFSLALVTAAAAQDNGVVDKTKDAGSAVADTGAGMTAVGCSFRRKTARIRSTNSGSSNGFWT